jgi:hypothetical protein
MEKNKQPQRQELDGTMNTFPPIARCAMDGAPVCSWRFDAEKNTTARATADGESVTSRPFLCGALMEKGGGNFFRAVRAMDSV